MSHIYIRGTSLTSALSNPDDYLSGKTNIIDVESIGNSIKIPFMSIVQEGLSERSDRLFTLSEQTVAQAIENAQLTGEELKRCGFFIGSTSYAIHSSEEKYFEKLHNEDPNASPFGLSSYSELPHYIKRKFAPTAPIFTFNTACTSSANAMIYGSEMIKKGEIDHAIIVGLEFFNQTTLLGFHSLNLISEHMQPFGQNRNGLNLGEACSTVILSKTPSTQTNAQYTFEGGATVGDTYSMTSTNPDGSSITSVINKACEQANISTDQIKAIKLHGTASLANDDTEYAGLKNIYGENIPPVCAMKPLIGHTLGACGTNELALLLPCLEQGFLPKMPGQYELDKSLPIGLSFEEQAIDFDNNKAYLLLNYFGFGGNNTALIIGRSH